MGAQGNKAFQANKGHIEQKGTVLLVHEEREKRHYYRAALESLGLHVWSCGSYEECEGLLDSQAFDFIVVNQGTPRFEGRRVLQRALDIDRHMPVLVVARAEDTKSYLEAMQLGAVDYLPEPVTMKNLQWVLKTHMRLRSGANAPEPKGQV